MRFRIRHRLRELEPDHVASDAAGERRRRVADMLGCTSSNRVEQQTTRERTATRTVPREMILRARHGRALREVRRDEERAARYREIRGTRCPTLIEQRRRRWPEEQAAQQRLVYHERSPHRLGDDRGHDIRTAARDGRCIAAFYRRGELTPLRER